MNPPPGPKRPTPPPASSLPPDDESPIHPALRAPPAGAAAEALRSPGQLGQLDVKQPSMLLAPLLLLFSPATFWRHFANAGRPNATILFAFLLGVALSIDRFEVNTITGHVPFNFTWMMYWLMVIAIGALGGLLNYWIRGWWYKVRISFCGVEMPDPRLARHVYVTSSLVISLPIIAYSLVMTVLHADPITALNHIYPFDWALLIFPFWATIVSYNGVRTVFGARPGAAMAWFLILPGILYGFGLAAAAVAILFLNGAMPADINHPVVQDEGDVRFHYPGNWVLDDWAYDADSAVTVSPWVQDAYYSVVVHEDSKRSAGEILDASVAAYQKEAPRASILEEDAEMLVGVYPGVATIVESGIGDARERFTCFVHEFKPGHYLEIQRSCYQLREKAVEPGFDLIDRTLVVVY